MSLIHRPDQITGDIVALECHDCHERFAPDDELASGSLGDLACPSCGTGGLIPHRQSKLHERFPAAIAQPFTPLPEALMDHRAELGIGPNELLVIIALERHRRLMGDLVFPSQERIAGLTGLSVSSTARAIKRLRSKKLVSCSRPGIRGGAGGRGHVRYDLDPLWVALANLPVSLTDNHKTYRSIDR